MSFALPTTDTLLADVIVVAYRAAIFFLILAVGWAAGKAMGFLIGKVVSKAGGDSLLRRTVIGRTLMKTGYNSFRVGQSITKWIIYLVAFAIALESLSLPLLTSSVDSFLAYVPSLIGSLLILLVGIILSDWVGEFVKRSSTVENRELFYLDIVGDTIKIILYFVTITLALSRLGVDVTILYIIAQAFSWAVAIVFAIAAGIIIGWTFKDKAKELLERYKR